MANDSAGTSDWFKWTVGIVISLMAAGGGIVALLQYIGAPHAHTLSGTWSYTMKSNISGRTYQGFMHLTQDGTTVGGDMDSPGGKAGVTNGVAGTYVRSKLKLSRDTGMNTSQEYELNGAHPQLAGTFHNVGDYADSGTIEIRR